MGRKIRIDGRLYEEVRPSGRGRSRRGYRSLREALDWNIFSEDEKEEIRGLLSGSIYDIRYDRSEEALDSVRSFLESVDMSLEDYSVELDFGIEDTRLDVELGESWYNVEDLGGLDGGVSNGYYVGEGMLTVWEKNLPKLRRLADKWVDAFDAHDPDDWDDDPNDDPKFNRAEDAFLKAAEAVKDALVEVASDDITTDVADAGSDYWFEQELDGGSEWVVNTIDDYLLSKEDSGYADNESVRLVREATSRGKSKKGPRKFYVGEVIDGRTPRGEGLCYEVVARTQRTVTFHVTGDDDNYNGPDGTVDDELTCKINRNTVNRNESAFVHYGMVAYA